jgi:hypothetical protein
MLSIVMSSQLTDNNKCSIARKLRSDEGHLSEKMLMITCHVHLPCSLMQAPAYTVPETANNVMEDHSCCAPFQTKHLTFTLGYFIENT